MDTLFPPQKPTSGARVASRPRLSQCINLRRRLRNARQESISSNASDDEGSPKRTAASPTGSSHKELPPKGLRPLPRSAPRDTITKGKYTFIKGVRIRDYDLPYPQSESPSPQSLAFQCRDGFTLDEVSQGHPKAMIKPQHSESGKESPKEIWSSTTTGQKPDATKLTNMESGNHESLGTTQEHGGSIGPSL